MDTESDAVCQSMGPRLISKTLDMKPDRTLQPSRDTPVTSSTVSLYIVLFRSLYTRDVQTHRSCFKCHGSADVCMTAVNIKSIHQTAPVQRSRLLCPAYQTVRKPGPSENQMNRNSRLSRRHACEDCLEYAGLTS